MDCFLIDVVFFHQYLNPKHFYLNSIYGNRYCCCNSTICNDRNADCKWNCNTFFKVCYKGSTLISETCYNTTEPTGDNTTFLPFSTPNRVQFYANTLCEMVSIIVLPKIFKYLSIFYS